MNKFNLRNVIFENTVEAKNFLDKYIHCEDYGVNYMCRKVGSVNIVAENLRAPACHILKQTMLSLGGEVALPRDVLITTEGTYTLLLMGTRVQFRALVKKLKPQAFGLPQLGNELTELLDSPCTRSERVIPYATGELVFGKKTLVMGILNCTPDSFSDGGKWFDADKAVEHALAMERDGADIIDIGGESTRPGSDPVSDAAEIERVVPVIKALQGKLKIPISIDSYKAATARAALEAGAVIINDVWGLQRDSEMAQVGAEYKCPIIIMHNKTEAEYDNLFSEIIGFLRKSLEIGMSAGCKKEQFIVDPGFGFGKDIQHNLAITKKLYELSVLGCPILMAASRKKTVGLVLNATMEQRLEGDAAITAMSIANGADMVRVHDVKQMAKVAKMADAIINIAY